MTTSKLVTLESFTDPFKARLVSQRLEEAGIASFLNGEESAATLGAINPSLAPVKLDVAEEDAERARQILVTPVETETGIQTEPDEPIPTEDLSASPVMAERSLRAAVIGLLLTPGVIGLAVLVYSMWLAGKIAARDEEMGDYAWKIYLALAIDAVGLVAGAIYIRALFIWIPTLFGL